MRHKFSRKYIYISLSIMLALCGAMVFYYLLFHYEMFFGGIKKALRLMMPVIDGFCVAYILCPALNHIECNIVKPVLKKVGYEADTPKRRNFVRGISIIITMAIAFLCVYVFLLMVIPQIVDSIRSLVYSFPIYVDNFEKWIEGILKDNPDIEFYANEYITTYTEDMEKWLRGDLLPQLNTVVKTVSNQVINIVTVLWNLVIGLIISVYMLASKELFAGQGKKLIFAFFNEKNANRIIDEFRFTHKTFGGFIIGKLLDSLIIGILCFAGCSILSIPYAVLVSVIVGVTNIIPFFGPYLGAIPSGFLILLVDPKKCLYFLIFLLILQQVDGNIIGPKILGDSTGLSGFWVICSITFFGGFFGILGMFIGVPVFAVIYSGVKRYCGRRLRNKNLPESTTAYMKLRHIHDGRLEINDDPSSHIGAETLEPVKITIQIDNSKNSQEEDKDIDNKNTEE